MREAVDHKNVNRAAAISLTATVVVVIVKLIGARLSGSVSVFGEAVQSLLDIFISGLVLWTVKVAAAPPDKTHPFGHGKAELLTSALQMVLAVFSAGLIIWQASLRLMTPQPIQPDWGLGAMVYAIVSNLLMITYLRAVIAQSRSEVIASEKTHLWSDTYASLGVIAGLILYRFTGLQWIDPAAAILFTGFGASVALKQLKDVIHPLMDGSLPPEEVKLLETALDLHPQVRGYHALKTRYTGQLRFVELHVLLDDDLTFVHAHDLAEHIEKDLSTVLGGASVTIHYEPAEAEMAHRGTAHK